MKVSIITPSLNQGRFIEETIKSVIYQEGDFELEYIIIDGGSKDETLQILKKYKCFIHSKKFKPKCKKFTFKQFSMKNIGQSETINKGFKIATGEVVNWLCSDDLLERGALNEIIKTFKKNKSIKIVFGDAYKINDESSITELFKGRSFTREELIRRWDKACCEFSIIQPAVFLKKSLLDEFGYLNESNHLCMDYEWWLKINQKYDFYYISRILASARLHKECKSMKFEKEQYKLIIKVSKKYWNENYILYVSSYYFSFILRFLWKLSKKIKEKSKLYDKFIKIFYL